MKKKIQKPFNVKAAKNGAKIETRDGIPVRIICYDREGGKYPIIALVDSDGYEICNEYDPEGKISCSELGEHDLVIVEDVEGPEFEVNDYIVSPEGVTYKVIEVDGTYGYKVLQLEINLITNLPQDSVNGVFHKWTIEDAKPGDVLIYEYESGKNPFIFKETSGGYPTAYCGLDVLNSIVTGTNGIPWTYSPIRPATSDEMKVLFDGMKDAGYSWDAESLKLTKIRWRDDEDVQVNGYFINKNSRIESYSGYNIFTDHNLFATEKQAKSALAMARISQIMANDERFGGAISYKEWSGNSWYMIIRINNNLLVDCRIFYNFLAFHTKEQAKLFLKENEDLIKDYYMMD